MTDVGPVERRRRTRAWVPHLRAAMRVLVSSAFVFVLYFTLPFSTLSERATWVMLALLLAAFVVLMVWQVRRIIDARNPRRRAVEALALSIPLLLAGFSTVHFVIGQSTPAAYIEPLTRTDALYFSVTVFSTVGFGDITAVSQSARVVVTVQMLVNLLVLGAGVRIIAGAVEVGRQRATTSPRDEGAIAPSRDP